MYWGLLFLVKKKYFISVSSANAIILHEATASQTSTIQLLENNTIPLDKTFGLLTTRNDNQRSTDDSRD